MNQPALALLCLVSAFPACSRNANPTTKTPTTAAISGGEPDHEEHHGALRALGELTIGANTFRVRQEGEVAAGKQVAFDLEFPADKPLPSVLRAWIGIESGVGSMKTRFVAESEHVLHGHIEVPKVLPAASKLWLEIEADGDAARASIAWQ